MKKSMAIPKITDFVASCWMAAEQNTIQLLANRHPDKDEEWITEFFHDIFREIVQEANKTHAVERAFFSDLKLAFPGLLSADLEGIAHGISVSTILHPRQTEKISGGC